MSKKLLLLSMIVYSLTIVSSVLAASGVTWIGPYYKHTQNLDFYTPIYIEYWGGYKTCSQGGAWGHHLYASTDWTYYDSNRQASLEGYWRGTNYQYVPTTIAFDDQKVGGGFHPGGLHATGWWYTNLPNPEMWSQDDNGDTRHEEIKIRWSPAFSPGGYNIEVEYWDPNFDFDTGLGSTGEMNVSAYITTAIGKWRVDHTWLCKFTYPRSRVQTWAFGC